MAWLEAEVAAISAGKPAGTTCQHTCQRTCQYAALCPIGFTHVYKHLYIHVCTVPPLGQPGTGRCLLGWINWHGRACRAGGVSGHHFTTGTAAVPPAADRRMGVASIVETPAPTPSTPTSDGAPRRQAASVAVRVCVRARRSVRPQARSLAYRPGFADVYGRMSEDAHARIYILCYN